jgi:galactose oxidase
MWGRREEGNPSLDVHSCTPFVWNPKTKEVTFTAQPMKEPTPEHPEETVNLFCSGHAFLPDGRLLVAGGHLFDSAGVNQATLYDWRTNTWTATAKMSTGRWYPTATTLPDGGVLVVAGSYKVHPDSDEPPLHNDVPEVWRNDAWTPLAEFPNEFNATLELYPRMHVTADGEVFMSAPLLRSFSLNTTGAGEWKRLGERTRQRDYCPAVMDGHNTVLLFGGGGG